MKKHQNWFVIAKLPGMVRYESIADAKAHGNREFATYSHARELVREFKRHGIPAKAKKARATI